MNKFSNFEEVKLKKFKDVKALLDYKKNHPLMVRKLYSDNIIAILVDAKIEILENQDSCVKFLIFDNEKDKNEVSLIAKYQQMEFNWELLVQDVEGLYTLVGLPQIDMKLPRSPLIFQCYFIKKKQ